MKLELFKKKLSLKLVLLSLSFSFFLSTAGAASLTSPENEYSNLHIITLSNGMTIFVREDSSSALLHAEFMSRAGFSSQTPGTAGFFPLYTELFARQMKADYKDFFDTVELKYSTNQESSTYSATIPPSALKTFFKAVSETAIHPSFSDKLISSCYSQMKKDVLEKEKSTTGLINSAIDSRVFAAAPWKHDTGIYPALFSGKTTSEVRTIISEITKKYYIPQNCALFISGNISHERVYNLALETFSLWKDYYSQQIKINSNENKNSDSTQRRFVIIDDSFSPDFTQLVVQYTSLSMSQADILSAGFNSSSSTYIEYEIGDPVVGLRSYDYLTSASVQQSESSRLILQALLEKPYSFTMGPKPKVLPSTAEQVMHFVNNAKAAASLSPQSLAQAQNEISSRYKTRSGSAVGGMEFIADYWALHPELDSEVFYSHFEALQEEIKNQSAAEIYRKVQAEEPFIFVLLNTKNYEADKDAYKANGFETVTRKNASWYRDQLVLQKALKDENLTLAEEKDLALEEDSEVLNKKPAQSFYEVNSKQIQSFTLNNGIPLVIKSNPKSQGILISICIDGGEAASPAKEHYQRTVIVNYLSVNLQTEINKLKAENKFKGETEIKSWTTDLKSYITISCLKEDLDNSLTAFVNAVIYGDIFPSTADRVMYELYGQWNTKISDMDFQMSQAALKVLYKGTGLEKNYDIATPILSGTTFQTLCDAYAQLINSSNYSLVIVGDIDSEDARTICEKNFTLLKGKAGKKNTKLIKPAIKSKTDRITIKHTYSTDIPAEMAGDTVPILVPTTEFKDPVQFWISAPADDASREIFNALLYELRNRMNQKLSGQAGTFVVEATNTVPLACIKTPAILYSGEFLKAYKKAVREMKEDLKTENQLTKNREKEIKDALSHNKNVEKQKAVRAKEEEEALKKQTEYNLDRQENPEKYLDGDGNPLPYEDFSLNLTKVDEEIDLSKLPPYQSQLLENIITRWELKALSRTQSNEGTAQLIQQGLITGNGALYLNDYLLVEEASLEKMIQIADKYFPDTPTYEVYSKDAK